MARCVSNKSATNSSSSKRAGYVGQAYMPSFTSSASARVVCSAIESSAPSERKTGLRQLSLGHIRTPASASGAGSSLSDMRAFGREGAPPSTSFSSALSPILARAEKTPRSRSISSWKAGSSCPELLPPAESRTRSRFAIRKASMSGTAFRKP
eukprot:scaffold7375_cov268-Pinguiococcus_pyrenoidosus.AAC.13